jgi:hypothetical protein
MSKLNEILAIVAGVTAIGAGSAFNFNDATAKAPMKCRLPSCMNMTTHNGGYCCAEHCKKHRKQSH